MMMVMRDNDDVFCCPCLLVLHYIHKLYARAQTAVIKEVAADKHDLKAMLEDQANMAGHLVCFLDCDREGENIAFEVIDVCRAKNSRLRVLRAVFSALIPADIHNAMRNLREPDKNLSDAVDARQEIDLRLGAAFTRFQTKVLGTRYAETHQTLLSWGPCQFATLGFIVDRQWKIDAFVPENFWGIDLRVKDETGGNAVFNWQRYRLYDRQLCLALYEMCAEEGQGVISRVQERETRKLRPEPLSTVKLQTESSRKLGDVTQIVEGEWRCGFGLCSGELSETR